MAERVLHIRTNCRSIDELVNTYALLVHGPTCFFITTVLHEVGYAGDVDIALADGRVVFRGTAQVIESVTAERSAYGRPGMRLRFLDARDDGPKLLARLMRSSADIASATTTKAGAAELSRATRKIAAITTRTTKLATERIGAIKQMPRDTLRLLYNDFELQGGGLQEIVDEQDEQALRPVDGRFADDSEAMRPVDPRFRDRNSALRPVGDARFRDPNTALRPVGPHARGKHTALRSDDVQAPADDDPFAHLAPALLRLLECDVYEDDPAPAETSQPEPRRSRALVAAAIAGILGTGIGFAVGYAIGAS